MISGKHTHSDRLERWLGPANVRCLSRNMRDFYWPIAVHGVPGAVYAMPGGDFVGEIKAGQEMSAVDRAIDLARRMRRSNLVRHAKTRHQLNAFASLSALIAAATGGKAANMNFNKVGVASNAVANAVDLWRSAGVPAAGAVGAAAPGGTVPTSASTGALPFPNAVANANSSHFVKAEPTATVAGNSLLLYDRLFAVAKTMNSTAIEGVTGVPTRYQSQTSTNEDYIGGNFCFPSVTTVLANTAHNWLAGDTGSPNQGCTYFDQGGVQSAFSQMTGIAACVAQGVDLSVNNWFMTLASGDVGVGRLGTLQCSAAVATGAMDFVIGHPIAFMPCPVANMVCTIDGINSAFNLTRVYDNACLAFLEMPKPATTATTYSGSVMTVSE